MIVRLRPFIVTSWHGHRFDPDVPDVVQAVWRSKFRPSPDGPRQSNVDLAVLDSSGRLVHHFDGFARPRIDGPRVNPGQGGRFRPQRPEGLAEYTARQVQRSVRRLPRTDRRRVRGSWQRADLRLPDLKSTDSTGSLPGIRVFVRLMDDRMKAYQAPVVEVVPLSADDWQVLAYPLRTREVDARKLSKWLTQIYPSGVMERTDPRTKKVYKIKSTEGTLTLSPAGSDQRLRYAVLEGEVELTDQGSDGFSYRGKLQVVLSYRVGETQARSLRGVFDGIYPRTDRRRGRTRRLPLRVAIESLPTTVK